MTTSPCKQRMATLPNFCVCIISISIATLLCFSRTSIVGIASAPQGFFKALAKKFEQFVSRLEPQLAPRVHFFNTAREMTSRDIRLWPQLQDKSLSHRIPNYANLHAEL